MNYLYIPLALGLILFTNFNSFSQSDLDSKFLEEVETTLEYGEYDYVLELVEEQRENSSSPLLDYYEGISHYKLHHLDQALTNLQKAKDAGVDKPDLYYYLGRVYHLRLNFDEAEANYKEFKKSENTTEDTPTAFYGEIEKLLKELDFGRKLVSDSLHLEIIDITAQVNSTYDDYVPFVSQDEQVMVFTSRRLEGNVSEDDRSLYDGKFFEDIYIAKKDGDTWGKAQNIGEPVNTKLHDACAGLSPDARTIYVYKPRKKAPKGIDFSGDLYESLWDGEKFGELSLVKGNVNSDYVESHATVTSDESTLYFVSDRPGGEGGMDIYMSKKEPNGEWGDPKNLGSTVNTPYDEDAPFIYADNKTLYFSSRGHSSMGGYDIFSTVYDEMTDKWSEPKNFGYPINTAGDDTYLVWAKEAKTGYFSSVRSQNIGGTDLYMIKRIGESTDLIVYKGHIVNDSTGEPVAATITVSHLESNQVIGLYNSTPQSGRFTATVPFDDKFIVRVQAGGYFSDSSIVEVPKTNQYYEIREDFNLKAVPPVPDTTSTDSTDIPAIASADSEDDNSGSGNDSEEGGDSSEGDKGKTITVTLENVLFAFDSYALNANAKSELRELAKILKEYPVVRVRFEGYTDAIGDEKYNQILSEKRAKAAMDYVAAQGVKKERLTSKGYGESNPIASNKTRTGRSKNRRTTLSILKSAPGLKIKMESLGK